MLGADITLHLEERTAGGWRYHGKTNGLDRIVQHIVEGSADQRLQGIPTLKEHLAWGVPEDSALPEANYLREAAGYTVAGTISLPLKPLLEYDEGVLKKVPFLNRSVYDYILSGFWEFREKGNSLEGEGRVTAEIGM